MKDFLKAFLGVVVFTSTFIVVLITGGFWWAAQEFNKPLSLNAPVEIQIESGANIGGVADTLLYHGVLPDALHGYVFQGGGRLTGLAAQIKAGEYEIPPQASMKSILQLFASGKTIVRSITIPEGLTNHRIKKLLRAHGGLLESPEFLMAPEGSYLPETYRYQRGDDVPSFMGMMKQAMEKTLNELWLSRADNLPIETKEQALVLASIVEKETGIASERARIAGVFINRLRLNMPLQSDPTVIYALTLGDEQDGGQGPLGRRLLKTDLEIDSPYNTYKKTGLPPAPICNAGRAAIEAVLHPEAHEFLYFVADGKGGHVFAKTLEEHNANVAKWREIRKEQED